MPGQLPAWLQIEPGPSNTWTLAYSLIGWDNNNPVPEGVGLLGTSNLNYLNGGWKILAAQVCSNAPASFAISKTGDSMGFFRTWSVTYAPGVFFLVDSNLAIPDGGQISVPFMVFDDLSSGATNSFVVQAIDTDSNRKLSEVLVDGPIGFGNLTLSSANVPCGTRNIHLVGTSTDGSEFSQDIQVPSLSSLAVTYPSLEGVGSGTNEGYVFWRLGMEAQMQATNGMVICNVYDDTSLQSLWTNTLDLSQALVPGLYEWPGPVADGYGFTNSGFLVSLTVVPSMQFNAGGPGTPPRVNPTNWMHLTVVRSHPQRGATIVRAYTPPDSLAASFEVIAMQDLALEGLYAGDQWVWASDCSPQVDTNPDVTNPRVWDLSLDQDWAALWMLMNWPRSISADYTIQFPGHDRWTNTAPMLMKYFAAHAHGNSGQLASETGHSGVDMAILNKLQFNATNHLSFCSLNGCSVASGQFLESLLDNNGKFGYMTLDDMAKKGVPPHWGSGFKNVVNFNSWDLYYFIAQVAYNQCGGGGGSLPTLYKGYQDALNSNPPSQGQPVQTGVDGIHVYDQW
jgi:hypothetical protein